MPNIALPPYSSIIQSIPVLAHTIEVNLKRWQRLISSAGLSHPILSGLSSYAISRDRLFNHSYSTAEDKCLEILMWGYSTGGRGTNIIAALTHLPAIAAAASAKTLRWPAFFAGFGNNTGVGISTATKFAYFFHHTFSGDKALIFDEQLAQVLNSGHWNTHLRPVGKHRYQWENNYPAYLNQMNALAASIGAQPDQVELFLYLMGPHFR